MKESKKTIRNLVLVVAGMFAFGFLLVPIYDVFCEITGLNGKVTGPSDLSEIDIQTENQREVLSSHYLPKSLLLWSDLEIQLLQMSALLQGQ